MARQKTDRGFTLVELLVVIGIIALLIAILMPALSRARKQALEASCGSNERQITYGTLAYGNDFKEQLPTRIGNFYSWTQLFAYSRLPVIGFDTQTVWDILCTYIANNRGIGYGNMGLGGWAFMMRDYLKNDYDVALCPDGWFGRDDLLVKWAGQACSSPCTGTMCTYWGDQLYTESAGYLWLPHRPSGAGNPCANGCGGPSVNLSPGPGVMLMADTPRSVAKTASDKPDLLIVVDYNHMAACWDSTECYAGHFVISSNHVGTGVRRLPRGYCSLPKIFPPDMRANNPEDMPLGLNRARIDARVQWEPFQDWNYFQWFAGGEQWHGW